MKFLYGVIILYFRCVLGKKLEKSCYNQVLSFYVIIKTIAKCHIEKTGRFFENYSNIFTNSSTKIFFANETCKSLSKGNCEA